VKAWKRRRENKMIFKTQKERYEMKMKVIYCCCSKAAADEERLTT
jgi:hypothetical protein